MGGEGRERGKCGSDGGRCVPYCKTMYQHVNYKPELLHIPVTFVRGNVVSSTRLVRKVSQISLLYSHSSTKQIRSTSLSMATLTDMKQPCS